MTFVNTHIVTNHSYFKFEDDVGKFKTTGLNLMANWNINISTVAIISDENDLENTASRLNRLGYSPKIFPKFKYSWDKLEKTSIIECPDEYINSSWLLHVRNMNHNIDGLSFVKILNHMSVWHYVIANGPPAIISETPSLITKKHDFHVPRNSIIDYSGTPMFQVNKNWHSLKAFNYYSVDQFSAKCLFNHIMNHGIRDPLDVMIRDDTFMIVQQS